MTIRSTQHYLQTPSNNRLFLFKQLTLKKKRNNQIEIFSSFDHPLPIERGKKPHITQNACMHETHVMRLWNKHRKLSCILPPSLCHALFKLLITSITNYNTTDCFKFAHAMLYDLNALSIGLIILLVRQS